MKKGRNIEIEKEGQRNNSNGHKSMGGKMDGQEGSSTLYKVALANRQQQLYWM